MATTDTVQKIEGNPQLAADPNVNLPEHVRRAAAEAAEIHQRAYPKDPNQPDAANKEAIPQPPQPDAAALAAQEQARIDAEATERAKAQAAQTTTQQPPQPQEPPDSDVSAEGWRHRFLSMQGRYNAAAKSLGAMEQQMQEMAQELQRTHSLLAAARQAPPLQDNSPRNHANVITEEDRTNYGDDLIDLTARVARATVTPELEALRAENRNLKSTVSTSVRSALFNDISQSIPNWRQINATTQWKSWLTLRNIYTGQVRQQILNEAIAGANAPKVVALFKDFLAEANATGMTLPQVQQEQRTAPPPNPPREAALDLGTLAAPGRAKPAAGDSTMPADKPIYTRAQISKFYADSRKGLYAGREAEYRATEADLQLAQAEGRIR
jgi:hypothetical protein